MSTMFTGIIKEIGTVVARTQMRGGVRLRIRAAKIMHKLRAGSSVSVGGVCLTVERKGRSWFEASAVPQTLKVTTLGKLAVGDRVNLEPALRAGDELGGHFVYGHVDGIGIINHITNPKSKILNLKSAIEEDCLRLWLPKRLLRYTVNKGSITIDGASLTIARKLRDDVEIALVPYTLRHTTLGRLKVGDLVNIETDHLLKRIGVRSA